MRVLPFSPEHLEELSLQPSQAHLRPYIQDAQVLALGGEAYTGFHNGEVIGCAGIFRVWEGRAMVWALLSPIRPEVFIGVHRVVRDVIARAPFRRIEATVDEGFAPGHRWVQMLGFRLETPEPMRGYRPDGGACYLYARVT